MQRLIDGGAAATDATQPLMTWEQEADENWNEELEGGLPVAG